MKFFAHGENVLVVNRSGTLSFPSEVELIQYMLKTVTLEVLLLGVQRRTDEFVGHKKSTAKLKEIVDGITAASVAEALTALPLVHFPQPPHDDRSSALKFNILQSDFKVDFT